MKKIACWLIAGVLLLAPVFAAYADSNPRIITVDGGSQLGTAYYTDFGSDTFLTQGCENPTQVGGIPAWA